VLHVEQFFSPKDLGPTCGVYIDSEAAKVFFAPVRAVESFQAE
jgi:hypothetical protein